MQSVINEICFIDTPMTACALCGASEAMSTPMPRGNFFLSQFSFRFVARSVMPGFQSANMQKERGVQEEDEDISLKYVKLAKRGKDCPQDDVL